MRKQILIIPVFLFLFSVFFQSSMAQSAPPDEWAICSACHTIGKGKLIGPDLKGVTERREEAWLYSFIKSSQTMVNNGDADAIRVFEEHNKIPMPDNNFTDDQIKGILNYIENYVEGTPATETTATGMTETQEVDSALGLHKKIYGPGNTWPTFIIFFLLFIVALIDLGITKVIKAKFIHIIIILVSLFVIGELTYVEAKAMGRQQGYSPDQPVWFSHKVHTGQNQIDCLYCHTSANDSKSAGIPGTGVCMNCHNVVKKGAVTGEKEIAKVIESWNTGKPIKWVRVHNLPDHVWFSHAQHVNAGKRECKECHGAVEEMDRVEQVEDLGMGWCINCHRDTEVQFAGNGFYKEYVGFHEEINAGIRSRVTVDDIGGNNCQTCHY